MIEFIPFMLIILGFDPDQPSDIALERVFGLYATIEACEEAGVRLTGERANEADGDEARVVQYRCLEAPAPREMMQAFEELQKSPK